MKELFSKTPCDSSRPGEKLALDGYPIAEVNPWAKASQLLRLALLQAPQECGLGCSMAMYISLPLLPLDHSSAIGSDLPLRLNRRQRDRAR